MDAQSEIVFDNITEGLRILKPYIDELVIESVPNSYGNGEAKHSSMCYIGVTLTGEREIPNREIDILRVLGWVCDYPYFTLYYPNPFDVALLDYNETTTSD